MSKEDDWIEVCWCPSGHKIIRPWKEFPNGLYGQTTMCPTCQRIFIVSHAILRDRDTERWITNEGYQLQQTTIQEFYE